MSIAFQSSDSVGTDSVAFTKSICASRNLVKANTSAAMVMAVYPLWGFGTFNAVNTAPSSSGQPMTYNQTWPHVYNTLTETWTGSNPTGIRTTTFTPNVDIIFTTTDNGNLTRWNSVLSVQSTVITGSLVTINFTDGFSHMPAVYTAQLSGTILNPAATGPFDLADWGNLTNLSLALMDLVSLPIMTNLGLEASIIWPASFSPGYFILPPGNTNNLVVASALGVPMSSQISNAAHGGGSISINNPFNFQAATIADFPSPFNAAIPTQNYGCCVCLKSAWTLCGVGPTFMRGFLPAYVTSNNHLSTYFQSIAAAGAGGGFTFNAPAAEAVYSPRTINFNPYALSTFGMLGFLPTIQ